MSKKPQIQTRKPPAATASSMEAFVAGDAAVDDAGGPAVDHEPASSRKAKRAAAVRRVTLYMPVELHKRARIAAINANVPLSTLVMRSLEKTLKKDS